MTLTRAALATVLLLTTTSAFAQNVSKDEDLRRPTVCTEQYAPVCGRLNTITKTYPNQCYARAAGAEVIAQGPCGDAGRVPAPR